MLCVRQGSPLHGFENLVDRLVHVFVFASTVHALCRANAGLEPQLQVHRKEIPFAVVTVWGFERHTTT